MFKMDGFANAFVSRGGVPRIFVYKNREDTLSEIMEPGYFNKQKLVLSPDSFIKIIAKDAIAEVLVKENAGLVTLYPEHSEIQFKKPKKKSLKKTG